MRVNRQISKRHKSPWNSYSTHHQNKKGAFRKRRNGYSMSKNSLSEYNDERENQPERKDEISLTVSSEEEDKTSKRKKKRIKKLKKSHERKGRYFFQHFPTNDQKIKRDYSKYG